jgi:hypothetical protein
MYNSSLSQQWEECIVQHIVNLLSNDYQIRQAQLGCNIIHTELFGVLQHYSRSQRVQLVFWTCNFYLAWPYPQCQPKHCGPFPFMWWLVGFEIGLTPGVGVVVIHQSIHNSGRTVGWLVFSTLIYTSSLNSFYSTSAELLGTLVFYIFTVYSHTLAQVSAEPFSISIAFQNLLPLAIPMRTAWVVQNV